MTYSMALVANKESEFPPPPNWLIWRQEIHWDYRTRTRQKGEKGQVRHVESLEKAKKNVYTSGSTFSGDWAIYEWNHQTQKYELRYEGKGGDYKVDHPLFKRNAVKKTGKGGKSFRTVTDDDLAEVLASLGLEGAMDDKTPEAVYGSGEKSAAEWDAAK